MIKLFLITSLLFYLFGLTSLNANYTEEDLYITTTKLEEIKSGDKIKTRIDLYIKKYENNKTILEKLAKKLSILDNKLKDKTDTRSRLLKIMIKYLSIKVYFSLEDLLKEVIKEEEIIIEDEVEEEIIFPGFSDKYNDFDKNILAGEETFVYAGGAGAFYEKADVSGIKFYITGDNISNLKHAIDKSYLYVEGLLLKTSSYSDIDILSPTKASISFKNIDNFILPTDGKIDFRLSIKTNSIGYEKIGKTMKNLIVSDIDFFDVTGVTSDRSIVRTEVFNFSSEYFSILPSILSIETIKDLDSNYQVELNIKSNFGKNTIDLSKREPLVKLDRLKILVWGNNSGTSVYSLYNKDNSSDKITGIYNSSVVEFDLSTLLESTAGGNKGENYVIDIPSTADKSIGMELIKKGIIYSIDGITNSDNLNINLERNINLGYRDF